MGEGSARSSGILREHRGCRVPSHPVWSTWRFSVRTLDLYPIYQRETQAPGDGRNLPETQQLRAPNPSSGTASRPVSTCS